FPTRRSSDLAAAAGEVRLALRDQVALEPAGNAHVLGPDVGLDLALRGQRDVAVCVDLPLHLSVDPQGACRDDGTLELRALTDDGDLSILIRHGSLLSSLGDGERWHRRRLAFLTLPDHRAFTTSSGAASACRIASSSSTDRL